MCYASRQSSGRYPGTGFVQGIQGDHHLISITSTLIGRPFAGPSSCPVFWSAFFWQSQLSSMLVRCKKRCPANAPLNRTTQQQTILRAVSLPTPSVSYSYIMDSLSRLHVPLLRHGSCKIYSHPVVLPGHSRIVIKQLSSEISLSKQPELSLSSIRIKADDLFPLEGSATLPGRHSFQSDSDHSEGGSGSDPASKQPLSRDDSSMAESESERLLMREPTSDVKSDSLSGAADDWGTAAIPVWYRHPPVLLALLANCVAGLCFAFMDEVRSPVNHLHPAPNHSSPFSRIFPVKHHCLLGRYS